MCSFNLNQFTYFEPNLSIIIREWSFLKMIVFVWDADSKFLMQMGLRDGGLFLKLNVWFWNEGLMIFSNHNQYFLRIFLIIVLQSFSTPTSAKTSHKSHLRQQNIWQVGAWQTSLPSCWPTKFYGHIFMFFKVLS